MGRERKGEERREDRREENRKKEKRDKTIGCILKKQCTRAQKTALRFWDKGLILEKGRKERDKEGARNLATHTGRAGMRGKTLDLRGREMCLSSSWNQASPNFPPQRWKNQPREGPTPVFLSPPQKALKQSQIYWN